MLYVRSARDGNKKGDISDIGSIQSDHILADSLTRIMSQAKLQSVLNSNKLNVGVEQ